MKIQQIDTPKGKVWEVNGYLIYNDEKVRVKKRGFDSRKSAHQWFNTELVKFANGDSKYNKKNNSQRDDCKRVVQNVVRYLPAYR